MKTRYCPDCPCKKCKITKATVYFCNLCGETLNVDQSSACCSGCGDAYFHYKYRVNRKIMPKQLNGYEYTEELNGQTYYIYGSKLENRTIIDSELLEVIKCQFQNINSPQEYKTLLTRLLKMKAFV